MKACVCDKSSFVYFQQLLNHIKDRHDLVPTGVTKQLLQGMHAAAIAVGEKQLAERKRLAAGATTNDSDMDD